MTRKYEHGINNINVERVQTFQYLGAMFTTNGDGASNIKQRLAMAVQALNNMQYLWKSASKELKLKVLRTCIFPIATYGCETWVGEDGASWRTGQDDESALL